jgi:hypothetical protein
MGGASATRRKIGGWGENGAYSGHPFPISTDALRRLPAPNPGRPGSGFLRCPAPAAVATPYRFSPATRFAAVGTAAITTTAAAGNPRTKPGSFCFAWGDGPNRGRRINSEARINREAWINCGANSRSVQSLQ